MESLQTTSVKSGFNMDGEYIRIPSGGTVDVQKERPDELVQDIKLRWKGIVGLDGDCD